MPMAKPPKKTRFPNRRFSRSASAATCGAWAAIVSCAATAPTLESYALAPEEAPPPVEPAPERFVQGIWDGSYTALPEVAVEVGHMIHLTATNLLALSRADADDTALVAGVVVAGAAAGHAAEWTVDHPVERPDWSALTEDGVSLLEPGAPYFLSARVAGGISLTPPAVPGQWVVPVGHAVAPTVLHVTPGTPVRL